MPVEDRDKVTRTSSGHSTRPTLKKPFAALALPPHAVVSLDKLAAMLSSQRSVDLA